MRQLYAAYELSLQTKFNVIVSGEVFSQYSFFQPGNLSYEENPLKALRMSCVSVLPFPAANIEKEVSFIDVVAEMKGKDGFVISGKFSPYMLDILDEEGVRYADCLNDECFNIKNAYITAEGAINLAMNSLDIMLRDADCVILGFGRIGKALGEMLMSLGCRPQVYARRKEVRALAREMGFSATDRIDLSKATVIFNTVPQRIISNDCLLELKGERTFIELASSPGGFDPEIAKGCSHKVIDGKALPGKYAPKSAGRVLAQSIVSILNRSGEAKTL